MINSRKYVEQDLHQQKALKRQYRRKLTEMPEGYLELKSSNGKDYYSHIVNGKHRYLGSTKPENQDEIERYKIKRYLEEAMKLIDHNCRVMEEFLKKYTPIEPDRIISMLPRTYSLDTEKEYQFADSNNEYDWTDMRVWAESPYERNTKFPQRCRFRTIKGDLVRSKSEVIIADMLQLKGIDYHYEERLFLGNRMLAPDFTIAVKSEKRFKRLEHFGMVGEEWYLNDCLEKIACYLKNGYMPFRDVIFTFDNPDGSIDAQQLDWIITKFCM